MYREQIKRKIPTVKTELFIYRLNTPQERRPIPFGDTGLSYPKNQSPRYANLPSDDRTEHVQKTGRDHNQESDDIPQNVVYASSNL